MNLFTTINPGSRFNKKVYGLLSLMQGMYMYISIRVYIYEMNKLKILSNNPEF